MARINRCELTKLEIIRVATKNFLENGYTKTQVRAIAKELNMSPGNLTFHYPTKEYMLAELVSLLCKFQWKLMKEETQFARNSIMALCLELATMAATCDADESSRDFFVSAYTNPVCLSIIRKNDTERAKVIFHEYCHTWSDEKYIQTEILVSGIEFATFMSAGEPVSLETRIKGALNSILALYNVPKEVRKEEITNVLAMDYKDLGQKVLQYFKTYVDESNEQAMLSLLKG